METFPEDPFEKVGARIVKDDDGDPGGRGLGWWRPWNSYFWMRRTG